MTLRIQRQPNSQLILPEINLRLDSDCSKVSLILATGLYTLATPFLPPFPFAPFGLIVKPKPKPQGAAARPRMGPLD